MIDEVEGPNVLRHILSLNWSSIVCYQLEESNNFCFKLDKLRGQRTGGPKEAYAGPHLFIPYNGHLQFTMPYDIDDVHGEGTA